MKWFLKIARLLVVFSLMAWNAPSHAQTSGPQYIVQVGDTLFDIARQFGLTLEALQAANPDLGATLSVRRALNIPGYAGLTGQLTTHTLAAGETLDSLALQLGLKREMLIRLNRVVNPDMLYINESVVILSPEAASGAQPTGVVYPARAGLLALAVARNQNPWALSAVNQLAHPSQHRLGQTLFIAGGERPTSALPFPIQTISLHPVPSQRGQTLALRVTSAQPITLTGTLGVWPLHFNVESDQAQVAMLGLNRLADPDLYRLTLSGETPHGAFSFSQPFPVRPGRYASDPPLTVDPETIDPAITGPELDQIIAVVSRFTPQRYWNGPFALPSVGVLRSVYGSLRSYNGGPYDSFHTGVDFTGAEDRPVTAPAPGRVVFTGTLTVRGNATIIDHGWGVYTGYWHQSQVLVKVGDKVETGQQIGFQGATGRVTGPHLHWELWVGGYQVDPMQWTEETFP